MSLLCLKFIKGSHLTWSKITVAITAGCDLGPDFFVALSVTSPSLTRLLPFTRPCVLIHTHAHSPPSPHPAQYLQHSKHIPVPGKLGIVQCSFPVEWCLALRLTQLNFVGQRWMGVIDSGPGGMGRNLRRWWIGGANRGWGWGLAEGRGANQGRSWLTRSRKQLASRRKRSQSEELGY